MGKVQAHSGPPYPIIPSTTAGPYVISVWSDPDATDDGSPGGRFWVTLAASSGTLPRETRAVVGSRPLDRTGQAVEAAAEPIDRDVSRQFASLVMAHEGRFKVHVAVDGPLGQARVDADVDATYDLRPPPVLLFVYLVPFLLVGGLWTRLLVRRRRGARGARGAGGARGAQKT